MTNPMENVFVPNGMKITYGKNLIEEHVKFVPILVRCFACIIFHSEKLKEVSLRNHSHDFNKLLILQKPEMLIELRKLVTTDPTEGVINKPTGIPPHINQTKILKEVVGSLSDIKEIVKGQSDVVIKALNGFMEKRAANQ